MRKEKNRTQSIRRRIALILACTMLMGQTAWVQAADAESGNDLEENVRENPMAEMEKMAESTMEENDAVAVDKKGDEIPEGLEMAGGAEITEEADAAKETEGMGDADGESEDVETAEQYRDSTVEEGTEIDTERIAICKDYPIIVESWLDDWDPEAYCIESVDENICQFTATVETYDGGYGKLYLTLNGVNTGETVVCVKNNDVIVKQYEVIVNPLPEDAVVFPDIVLRSYLIRSYYDQNQDGCINETEIINVEDISVWGTYLFGSIKDLTGLEHAVNLKYLDLSYHSELTDISALFELDSLQNVDLTGTNVSDEDRWKLADFQDTELPKGEQISIPALQNIFDEDLQIIITDGAECVEMTQPEVNVAPRNMSYTFLAKKEGTVQLKIQYHELVTDITLTVVGISAEQDIGEKYDVEVEPINNQYTDAELSDKNLILDSSHHLWQIYPASKKIADNVKDYVSNWVYDGDANVSERYSYLLDMDNVLWDGTSKLAEDVVRFDGRYAMDKNGTLHNVYNVGAEQVEGVEDWISPEYGDEGMAYLLKQDGTLWKRLETASDQIPQEWEFVEKDIRQILRSGNGYVWLKTDGTIVSDKGIVKEMDAKVGRMCFYGGDYFNGDYYDLEGSYYVPCFWWDDAGEYQEEYRNLGKMVVMSYCYDYFNSETGDCIVYVLTEDHIVYKYSLKTGEKEEFLTNVAEVEWMYSWENSWTYHLMDGTYCDWDGNPMSTVSTDRCWDYRILQYSDGSQMLVKNDVPILNCVTDIWVDWGQVEPVFYAVRTDGTVWNVTGVPVQVLDLKDAGYDTGDLNDDNSVNLIDLMMCLNHVSKKSELTGDALAASDINGDGKVDLIDLMRILNYVSKKTTKL